MSHLKALQWSVTTCLRATKRFEFIKNDNLKADHLFHTKSNLLCLLCRCVVSFLFAPRCISHWVRTWCVVFWFGPIGNYLETTCNKEFCIVKNHSLCFFFYSFIFTISHVHKTTTQLILNSPAWTAEKELRTTSQLRSGLSGHVCVWSIWICHIRTVF